MKAIYFKTGAAFRAWLEQHHGTETELLLGFHKKSASTTGITYQEALDEALAFGWIDGIRRRVDDARYSIRFTPRKPRSTWSAVNIKRVRELIAADRMLKSGLAAFEKRDEQRSAVYSYERAEATFDPLSLKQFKSDQTAWADFQARPPWYRRTATHWATSAKKPETRAKRLATLIECSRKGERIHLLADNTNNTNTKSAKKGG
ncbi:MAG TPA: YdeI/OmpD-associated family protein [Gemmatimonadaceae bacterium]|nr:YdeI/OmpD-associated family protein [Gemmatimonadaceae bacterium]